MKIIGSYRIWFGGVWFSCVFIYFDIPINIRQRRCATNLAALDEHSLWCFPHNAPECASISTEATKYELKWASEGNISCSYITLLFSSTGNIWTLCLQTKNVSDDLMSFYPVHLYNQTDFLSISQHRTAVTRLLAPSSGINDVSPWRPSSPEVRFRNNLNNLLFYSLLHYCILIIEHCRRFTV